MTRWARVPGQAPSGICGGSGSDAGGGSEAGGSCCAGGSLDGAGGSVVGAGGSGADVVGGGSGDGSVVGGWVGGDVVGVVGVGDDGFVLVDGEVDGLDVAEGFVLADGLLAPVEATPDGTERRVFVEVVGRARTLPAALVFCARGAVLVNAWVRGGFFLSGFRTASGIRSGSSSAAMSPNGSLSAFAAAVIMMSSPNGVDSCRTSLDSSFSSAASLSAEVSE